MSFETTVSRPQVIKFILEEATADDLDLIVEHVRRRRIILREMVAAGVRVGSEVVLAGFKPKYINGLRGIVTKLDIERGEQIASIALTRESTRALAMASIKYLHLLDEDGFDIRVPAGCCQPASN